MPRKSKSAGGQDPASAPRGAAGPPAASRPRAVPPRPTHDDIAARAYAIYEARAGAAGSPDADWDQAERELNAAYQRQLASAEVAPAPQPAPGKAPAKRAKAASAGGPPEGRTLADDRASGQRERRR